MAIKPDDQSQFRSLVVDIESELAHYYVFSQHSSIANHLIERNDIKNFLGDEATQQKEWNARAAVWLADHTDELFIGVHIHEDLLSTLQQFDPRHSLTEENLDAFTTVVEEISHFHLILNRAVDEKPVTRTELESQGEIDKLLLSALYLQRQKGKPHLFQLARKLFDQAHIIAEDHDTYWQATKYAARFWFHVAHTQKELNATVRSNLRDHYHASWDEKQTLGRELVRAA